MRAHPLHHVEGRGETGLGWSGPRQPLEEGGLEPGSGAKPHFSQQDIARVEAMVDRAGRRPYRPRDRSDRRPGRAVGRDEAARRSQDLLLAELR